MKNLVRANPVLHRLEKVATLETQAMGIRGVMIKTLLLCACVGLGVFGALFLSGTTAVSTALVWGGIGSIVLALVTMFIPKIAFVTAPLYAVVQGVLIGSFSLTIEQLFPGLVLNAVLLTIVLLVAMSLFYIAFPYEVQKFIPYIFGITGALAGLYLVDFLLNLFGFGVPYLHGGGVFGIIVAIAILAIATFNLLGDFTFIEQSIRRGEGKQYEWYAAFGLIVTLIWIYFRVVELLVLLAQRDEK